MATITLTDALAAQRDIGRSRVFYAVDSPGGTTPIQWDGTTAISLTWLCDTEGDLVIEPNPSFNRLTAPELTGDAPLKAYIQGEAPILNLPAVLADPDLRDILSPTGSASGGFRAQRPVSELTLVIFVEELFFNSVTKDYDMTLDSNNGTWLLDSAAITGRKLELFNLTAWLWRCFARKPATAFRHTDGGKAIQPVEIELMVDTLKPNGHNLYTIGDPYLAGLDLEGGT